MQVVVICDEEGEIIAIGRPGDVEDESSNAIGEVADPLPGQQVHTIDLPLELEKKPSRDLASEFRVALKEGRPRFVPVHGTTEQHGKR